MSNMRLLLIFVLTFTLSTQTDLKDNAGEDSTDNDKKDNDDTETNDDKDNADVDSTDNDKKDNDDTETNDDEDNADVDSTDNDKKDDDDTETNDDKDNADVDSTGDKDNADVDSMDNDKKDDDDTEINDDKDNADVDSMDNDKKDNDDTETNKGSESMMEKVMKALGDKGLDALMNMKEEDMDILMGCLGKNCTLEDVEGVIPTVFNSLKKVDNGKLICALIEIVATNGSIAEVLKEMDCKDIIILINALNEDEMKMLLSLAKNPFNMTALCQVGPKILKVFNGMEGGKGIKKLIALITPLIMGGGGGGGGIAGFMRMFLGDGGGGRGGHAGMTSRWGVSQHASNAKRQGAGFMNSFRGTGSARRRGGAGMRSPWGGGGGGGNGGVAGMMGPWGDILSATGLLGGGGGGGKGGVAGMMGPWGRSSGNRSVRW